MPRRFLIPISFYFFLIDSNQTDDLSDSTTYRARFPISLPTHTPWPTAEDETSFKELVLGLGLIYEVYNVTTKDGYVLNLNRIVNPNSAALSTDKIPVLMVNGLEMQSEAWLIQSNPHHTSAVALLESGYDVWMGDQRGSLRSRRHVTLDDRHAAFWDFTYHEVGVYDLPAFIDFVLEATGHTKLVYIGLSLGSTFYLVMCSELPEYQAKIFGSVHFAPVSEVPFLYQLPLQTQITFANMEVLMSAYDIMGVKYIRELPLLRKNIVNWCNMTVDLWMLSFRFGIGPGGQYSKEDICYQLALPFGGTSVTTVLHTIQMYQTGKFQQYDHGLVGNLHKYGTISPPAYDLKRVTVPTAVFCTDIDVFVPVESVERLLAKVSGPTYKCVMTGLSHVGPAVDSGFKDFQQEFLDVVDWMTGVNNRTALKWEVSHEKRDEKTMDPNLGKTVEPGAPIVTT